MVEISALLAVSASSAGCLEVGHISMSEASMVLVGALVGLLLLGLELVPLLSAAALVLLLLDMVDVDGGGRRKGIGIVIEVGFAVAMAVAAVARCTERLCVVGLV